MQYRTCFSTEAFSRLLQKSCHKIYNQLNEMKRKFPHGEINRKLHKDSMRYTYDQRAQSLKIC